MKRRDLFAVVLLLMAAGALAVGADKIGTESVRGTLVQEQGKAPAVRTKDGKLVHFEGDSDTMKVLNDERLKGMDLEAIGITVSPGLFRVNPIYKPNLFVHASGERLVITYWCNVCSIRTYAPGKCMCCQRETQLDLRKPDEK